jgi:hypothetical protein
VSCPRSAILLGLMLRSIAAQENCAAMRLEA